MAPSSDQRTTYGGDRTIVIPPEGGTATTTVIDARGVRRALGSDAVQCNVSEGFTLRFGVPSLRGCGGLLPGARGAVPVPLPALTNSASKRAGLFRSRCGRWRFPCPLGTWWTIAHHEPYWEVQFSRQTPMEAVAAVTQALPQLLGDHRHAERIPITSRPQASSRSREGALCALPAVVGDVASVVQAHVAPGRIVRVEDEHRPAHR